MALRDFANVSYIPVLQLRPAEMEALEELPEGDKDLLLPFIPISPWSTAHHLSSSLTRIENAYADRPCLVTLAEANGGDRPVHFELDALRNPANGYEAWCSFIEQNNNYIPTLQLLESSDLQQQAERLYSLDRGLIVGVARQGFGGLAAISRLLSGPTQGGTDVCILLDFGKCNRDILNLTLDTLTQARTILEQLPNAHIALSGSSFPEGFTGISEQEIFERLFFNSVAGYPEIRSHLIYSDRGSARAEQLGGGGGSPAPRIDTAQRQQWNFFRSDDQVGVDGYIQQANIAINDENWDSDLHIWGTQMIERSALGDRSAIVSAKRSTAVRINIHLHRQLFYNGGEGLYETDDEWTD